jgi:hypothetical protein
MDETEATEAGPDPRRDTHTSVDCATPDCVAQSHGELEKMNTTQVHKAHGTTPARVPFLSQCPKCKHSQAQWYNRGALLRLLNGDHPVEGHCVTCDEYWIISADERSSRRAQGASTHGCKADTNGLNYLNRSMLVKRSTLTVRSVMRFGRSVRRSGS